MQSIDFIIILIIGIILSIILGFGVVSVIDNKINNVSINIPPISVPQPTIIVKIDKQISNSIGDYDVYINNENNIDENKEHYMHEKIEGFENVVNKSTNTTIESKNKDTNNKQNNDNKRDIKEGKVNKTDPISPPKDMNICKNEFIYKNNSYRRISGNDNGNVEGCPYIDDDMNSIDYGEYYKSKISIVKSYFEDPRLRGYNILESDNYSGINEIGRIDLTKKSQHPGGYNTIKE